MKNLTIVYSHLKIIATDEEFTAAGQHKTSAIGKALELFGSDWHKAIVCGWPEWQYKIIATGNIQTCIHQAWYTTLIEDTRVEFDAILKSNYDKRLMEQTI